MEERLAKIEKDIKINQILLSVALGVVVVLLVSLGVMGIVAAKTVKEYKPLIEAAQNLDYETVEAGLKACQKLSESNMDISKIEESLGKLEELEGSFEALTDLQEQLPEILEMADAVISINEKIDKISRFFGK